MINAKAQTDCDCFERNSKLAQLYAHDGKSDSALITYQKAISYLPDSAINRLHDITMAKYYVQNQELEASVPYLKNAIKNGYPIQYIEKNEAFEPVVISAYWQEISETYRQTGPNFNWAFYNETQEMYGLDQSIRNPNELGAISDKSMYHLVDSISFNRISKQLDLYGYPSQVTHGFIGNDIMVFFIHASMYSENQFDTIIDILSNANTNCLCGKNMIALLTDRRIDWYYDKKQKFGTWNSSGKFGEIEDLTKIDSLRFGFNLLTLFDYGKISARELPEGYKKTNYPENYFCNEKQK